MKRAVPMSLLTFDYPRLFMMLLVTTAMGMVVYSMLVGVLW